MNIDESTQQLESLTEAWQLNEADLNQTDINAIQILLKENQELKKQLEEYKEQVSKGLYNTCLPYSTGYNKAIKDKEIQQKEFIKYLEDMLDYKNDIFSVVRVKDVLQKYKEIVNGTEQN